MVQDYYNNTWQYYIWRIFMPISLDCCPNSNYYHVVHLIIIGFGSIERVYSASMHSFELDKVAKCAIITVQN